MVVFGAHDGILRGLASETGLLLWSIELGSIIFSSPCPCYSPPTYLMKTTDHRMTGSSHVVVATTAGVVSTVDIRGQRVAHYIPSISSSVTLSGEIYSSPVAVNLGGERGAVSVFIGCRNDTIARIHLRL